MPRRWLKQRLPDLHHIQQRLGLSHKGSAIEGQTSWVKRAFANPLLWHINRHSIAGGVAVGLLLSWAPLPMQMLLAALMAAMMRVHVPVSVACVWVSNPFTAAPLLYAAWFAGSTLLGHSTAHPPVSWSLAGLLNGAQAAWPALALGAVFCALVSAVVGFFGTHLLWRLVTVRRWNQRKLHLFRQRTVTQQQHPIHTGSEPSVVRDQQKTGVQFSV